MKQTDPQYKLRLPQDLKDQIETSAKEAGRSMNAEIVARLERSFTADREVEEIAFESVLEAAGLQREIERLSKLLEGQKAEAQKMIQEQSKAIAAEVLKHLHAEAGETIEAARQAAAELKAAGKWPLSKP